MEAIGHPAHILHNAAHIASDVLPTDPGIIVMRLFSYASIYTVQADRLRDFYDFIGIQYSPFLLPSKTYELSLTNGVERILNGMEALKHTLLLKKRPPKFLLILKLICEGKSYLFLFIVYNYLVRIGLCKLKENSVIEARPLLEGTDECINGKNVFL